ncbi:YfdX family protein [Singulisphaera acidiphila]|uniref:YfdX protein n=1 Tax=Singulisphaera acidiphila (strain ATCC BAA-1392 / DSM 18658 / VKM B-2454 / MOB10) TaxID=886293 RepID=L0DFX6_SINAD|nr:YfdX family protein [Singulisphaera acidiphila]AGA27755.1 YfdX protein [Singulisphaera acidiphila DSM 18658]
MRNRYQGSTSSWRLLAAGLMAFLFIAVPTWGQQTSSTVKEDDKATDKATDKTNGKETNNHRVVRTFGSEKGYHTELSNESTDRLAQEDQRQLSLLMIDVFEHVEKARLALDADDPKEALKEVSKCREGTLAIRKMLPKTTIHTKTVAPDGKPIFEDELVIQDDTIPLYAGILHSETLAPIVEARRNAFTIAGLQVVESQRVITEAVAKLDQIDAQLAKATKALTESKSDVATKALAMALVRGLDFRSVKEDSELASARDAIWFAKRSLEEDNPAQAMANMSIAHQRLMAYREVLPKDHRKDVDEMLREVEQMENQLRQEKATPTNHTDRIRQSQMVTHWWDKVNTWFHRHL